MACTADVGSCVYGDFSGSYCVYTVSHCFGNSLQKLASQYIPLLRHAVDLLAHFRGLIMLVMLIVFFDVIFTALPNKKLTFKSQIPGAAICGVAWYIFLSVFPSMWIILTVFPCMEA